MKERSSSSSGGDIKTSRPISIHIFPGSRGPVAGQKAVSKPANAALLMSLPINSGTADSEAYEASCPAGAMATAYSYTRGE